VHADHGKQAHFSLLSRKSFSILFPHPSLNKGDDDECQNDPTEGAMKVLKSYEHGSKITPPARDYRGRGRQIIRQLISLDDSLVNHRIGYFHKTCNVGPSDVVHIPTFVSSIRDTLGMDVLHDVEQTLIYLFA